MDWLDLWGLYRALLAKLHFFLDIHGLVLQLDKFCGFYHLIPFDFGTRLIC